MGILVSSQKIITAMFLLYVAMNSEAGLLCMQRCALGYTWPRLVIGNDIIRLPVTQISAPPATTSQPDQPVFEQVGNLQT